MPRMIKTEVVNPLTIQKSHMSLSDKAFKRLEVLSAARFFTAGYKAKNMTKKITCKDLDGYKYEITIVRRKN